MRVRSKWSSHMAGRKKTLKSQKIVQCAILRNVLLMCLNPQSAAEGGDLWSCGLCRGRRHGCLVEMDHWWMAGLQWLSLRSNSSPPLFLLPLHTWASHAMYYSPVLCCPLHHVSHTTVNCFQSLEVVGQSKPLLYGIASLFYYVNGDTF